MAVEFRESEEIELLRRTLRRFVDSEMPRVAASRWDREDVYPRDVFQKLSMLGVNGLAIAEEHGGSGRDVVACMVTIEELSRRSLAVAVPYIMCACYAGMNISESASEEQKRELLPKIASGGILFAYGLTEPDVGADLASVTTTADRVGERIVVKGAKRFCTGAPFADYIYTLVRSDRVAPRYKNLSFVMIPAAARGVTIEPQSMMGQKGTATSDVTFVDVELPFNAVVGGEAGWNAGWGMLVGAALDTEKLEVPAMSLGIAQAAVDDAWTYSQERKQFGKAICTIQSIRHMLADVQTKLHACRLVLYQAAQLAANRLPCRTETSMAKLFVCDTARDIVLTCQQVMGAYGYVKDYDMERYVRDILVMPIYGGSSAIQRNNIAVSLGLPR
jgi:alkylation response protein AidB-like acyl-CoA dehydrogenase